MNIRDLRYFLAVAELQHFGRAAERCHVSQPTLSGQIKKLEESLGVTLLERTNRRVMLTEIGEEVAASARRIMQEVASMEARAQHAQDPLSGNFRLGAFPTLASYVFPSLIPKITQALPKLRLILFEEKTATLLEQLHAGDIDAALLALPIDDDRLETRHLFDDSFYLATPPNHPLAEQAHVSQDMLSGERLLLLEEGHCLRDQALEVCQLHQISEEQDVRATSLETLRNMVKAGTGITFMPKIAITPGEKGIAYTPFRAPAPVRKIGLVWRKTSPRAAVMQQLITLAS